MAHVAGQILIHRPVEEVFDYVSDERNEPSYNPKMTRVEKLSDGPVGAGTVFRAEVGGADMTIEWTRFEPPRRLGLRAHLDVMEIDGDLTIEPAESGAVMHWDWELHPRGAMRLLGPVIGWMGRRQEREIWLNLKRVMEAQARPTR